ncbi:response regulator [Deferribacter autotrophicus]|uniref:histidine kinase n=1 Tax=Deferribacter autotrophicus TaxID=500465 RepID=A0A5A8F8P2_9BACT|nr:response regulator [Deferribacter autotrophicus]KAA0258812.1 response regulator [Deferribacter autotrophicus]
MANINKQELVNFFLMESGEHFDTIFNGINVLLSDPDNWSIIEEIFRSTHTLKGSSAMVEFNNFSEVAHSLENLLEGIKGGRIKRNKEIFLFLLELFHKLDEHLKKNKNDLDENIKEKYINKITSYLKSNETIPAKTKPELRKVAKPSKKLIDQEFPIRTPDSIDSYIRINIEKIDFLINLAGELIVARNRQGESLKEILALTKELEYSKQRLNKILDEFREKYMYSLQQEGNNEDNESIILSDFFEGEFDKYTDINILTRQLVEVGNDISSLISELFHKLSQFQTDILYINRVTDSIEKSLTKMKLVPVKNLFNTAMRTATITANNEGKSVNIFISGEKIEIDKSILDMINDAFLHLVRNSVSHGIETEKERKEKGKPATGSIYLRAYRSGTSIIFEIEDDGKGIDINTVKEKAVSLELIQEYEANNLRMDDLLQFIFTPGFSTAESITDVSGRGIGLDVVKRIVENLGGSVSVYTEKDKFTKFILVIPVTQFIAEYLIVKEDKHIFAIPLQSVYEIIPLEVNKIKKIGEHFFYNLRNEVYEIVDLMVALGVKKKNEFRENSFGILVDGPQKKYMIQVESILGRETTITKKFKPFLVKINKFLGTSVSPKGDVRLILDTVRLFSTKIKVRDFTKIDKPKDEKTISYHSNGILIVDDSISVRKYLSDILVKNGYKVVQAKDGLNALEILETSRFPYIITDLEMPNVNGYELIDKIRNSLQDNEVRIFVVTSRATEKHKDKALELGANGFIIKPFTEDSILKAIKGIDHESIDV